VTASQIGYVAGLAFLVPIGDIVERRRMIATILLGTAVAAAACAAAPGFGVLLAAMVALGALSVVAQVIVPLASTLAAPHERGQIVGTVMSGLLIGILMARTLSGWSRRSVAGGLSTRSPPGRCSSCRSRSSAHCRPSRRLSGRPTGRFCARSSR